MRPLPIHELVRELEMMFDHVEIESPRRHIIQSIYRAFDMQTCLLRAATTTLVIDQLLLSSVVSLGYEAALTNRDEVVFLVEVEAVEFEESE